MIPLMNMTKYSFIGIVLALFLVVGTGFANDAQTQKNPISIEQCAPDEMTSFGVTSDELLFAVVNSTNDQDLLAQVVQRDTTLDEFENFEDGLDQTQDHIENFPESGSNWSDYLQWISYFLTLFLLWRTWLMKKVLVKNKLE